MLICVRVEANSSGFAHMSQQTINSWIILNAEPVGAFAQESNLPS